MENVDSVADERSRHASCHSMRLRSKLDGDTVHLVPQSDSRSVGSLPQPLVSANDQGRRSHPSQVTGNVDVAEPAQRSGYNVSEGNDADVHSLISSRSSRMSSSSKSTIARKARLAALQQQKQFRILEQSLERDRLINEQKSRELKLDMEISMAQAELRIFEQFDDGGSPDPDISFKVPQRTEVQDDRLLSWVEGQQNVNAPETNMQNLRPTAVDFMPVQEPNQHRDQFHQRLASPFVEPNVCKIISPSPQTSAGDINRIIESLGDTLKGSQLPKLKLSVFSGDPLEFQQWLVTFKAVIEDKSTDPARRMQYLMQFTSGEPRTLISSYLLDQSSTGYASALQELIKEFGDPVVLARAYLGKIDTWQTIKTNDAAALKSLAIFLKKCRGSIPSLRHLQQLNTDLYLQKIIAKLPFPLQLSWRKTVDTLEQNNKDVTFNELVNFIDREARIAKHPVFSSVALAEAEGKNRAADTKLSVNKVSNPRSNAAYTAKVQVTKTSDFLDTRAEEYSAEPAVQASLRECMCSQSHDLDSCEVFLNKPVDERKAFLIKNRLCFGCYGHTSKTHDVRTCRKRRKCKICGKLHATGLHGSLPKKQPDNSSANAENETLVKTAISRATAVPIQDGGGIAMSLVMVRLTSGEKPDKSLVVYAALDNMSSACFISKDVWQRLGSPGNAAEITVKTINEERHQETVVVNNLYVSSVVDNTTIRLPKVFTQDTLPIDVSETPSHRVIANYPHLRHLTTEIPDRDETIPVGLLIGVNCPKALEPRGFIESVDNGPFAVKTSLGWCISGPLRPNDGQYADPVFSCNRTIVSAPRLLVQENDVKEMMIQMYESEFNEIPSCKNCSMLGRKDHKCDAKVSQDDVRFLTKMNAECNKIDGHYELPLPFRQQDVVLPNNRNQAVKRAEGIKRRFASNAKYKEDYSRFMKDIIGRGYVKKLSENSDTARIGENCWYIPHHGVYHPRKPDKIRVVFDCSARYAGISLNDKLLSGPNLSNSLVGVLIRFRQENIAIAADVECMFYQVKLPPSDRNYLRFLWWPDGNTNLELQDYEMCVHPFGAASSPSCANFALKRTADDNERQFGSKAADTLRENFYVDDMLKSVSSVTEAVKLVEDVRSMCAAGGFRLTKFVSNNEQVICSIPPSDRAKDFVDLDLVEMPIERALGVHWCIQNDSIIFRITLQDKPLTRRGMLSTVSSIYDPLGLAAPFLLEGKRLLQQVCNSNKGWDDDLNDDHKSAWERWRLNLPRLEQIEVQRSFKPTEFHSIKSATLHHFSDASQSGYGQCSYIRLVDESNKINCSLMMGKSRVVPWKPVTVPRLELTAACVSAKVGRMLETELQYENLTSVYWTDSNAVLGYINNDARRFHTFVANRVQQIREISEAESWKYINTLENPADDASRGIDILNISSDHRWFKGPEFIWLSEDHWPSKYLPKSDNENDPEVKKLVRAVKVNDQMDLIQQLEIRVSCWFRLKKYVAIWRRFINFIQKKSEVRRGAVTVEEMNLAEISILQSVQKRFFTEEVRVLSAKSEENNKARSLKKYSHVIKLDPFMDNSGLIRVGGRLRRSVLDEDQKHPVILPKTSRVSELIARWFHHRVQHGGRGLTLNEIRSNGYWIIAGNSLIRHLIYKCVTCRALRGKAAEQKMSDLPVDRVTSAPPFTYCAVDLFGPFIIKEGRKEVKRYGCLFTCLACRAIHIETTNSIDTSAFINALRRLIARRGNIRELRSDNGTNFVGAESELKRAWQEMNHSAVAEFLSKNSADLILWKRNPPTASHMGGVWERQIRSVRAVLSSLLKQNGHSLDDELFRTLLTEVEAIVNSRPLTVETLSDAGSPCPLTPAHLLTMKSNVIFPPAGIFLRTDIYCRQRWRRVQHIANEFWSRWNKEYLSSLQPRTKNQTMSRNLKVGDIVLLKETDSARNDWPIAKVIDTHYDAQQKCVRSVTLRLASQDLNSARTVKIRPVNKLILLVEVDVTDS